jgi:predicted PurR-regulated permease PerM
MLKKATIASRFLKLWTSIKSKAHWLWLAALVLALKIFAPATFLIMIMALILYIIFQPIVARLEKVTRSYNLAVVIFLVVLCSLLAFSIAFILPKLIAQISEFTRNIPDIQRKVLIQVSAWQNKFQIFQNALQDITTVSLNDLVTQYLSRWSQSFNSFFNTLVSSISRVATFLLHLLVAFIASIYLLFEKRSIFSSFRGYLELSTSRRIKKSMSIAYQQVISYFGGLVLLSFISFITAWIFFSLIGLRFSLLLALWTGLMEFIPIFGVLIALVLVLIIAWIQSAQLILSLLIFFLVMQFLLSHIIAPQVLGKTMNFSPLAIFLIMLVGAETASIWGMILSIPLVSILMTFWKVYSNKI